MVDDEGATLPVCGDLIWRSFEEARWEANSKVAPTVKATLLKPPQISEEASGWETSNKLSMARPARPGSTSQSASPHVPPPDPCLSPQASLVHVSSSQQGPQGQQRPLNAGTVPEASSISHASPDTKAEQSRSFHSHQPQPQAAFAGTAPAPPSLCSQCALALNLLETLHPVRQLSQLLSEHLRRERSAERSGLEAPPLLLASIRNLAQGILAALHGCTTTIAAPQGPGLSETHPESLRAQILMACSELSRFFNALSLRVGCTCTAAARGTPASHTHGTPVSRTQGTPANDTPGAAAAAQLVDGLKLVGSSIADITQALVLESAELADSANDAALPKAHSMGEASERPFGSWELFPSGVSAIRASDVAGRPKSKLDAKSGKAQEAEEKLPEVQRPGEGLTHQLQSLRIQSTAPGPKHASVAFGGRGGSGGLTARAQQRRIQAREGELRRVKARLVGYQCAEAAHQRMQKQVGGSDAPAATGPGANGPATAAVISGARMGEAAHVAELEKKVEEMGVTAGLYMGKLREAEAEGRRARMEGAITRRKLQAAEDRIAELGAQTGAYVQMVQEAQEAAREAKVEAAVSQRKLLEAERKVREMSVTASLYMQKLKEAEVAGREAKVEASVMRQKFLEGSEKEAEKGRSIDEVAELARKLRDAEMKIGEMGVTASLYMAMLKEAESSGREARVEVSVLRQKLLEAEKQLAKETAGTAGPHPSPGLLASASLNKIIEASSGAHRQAEEVGGLSIQTALPPAGVVEGGKAPRAEDAAGESGPNALTEDWLAGGGAKEESLPLLEGEEGPLVLPGLAAEPFSVAASPMRIDSPPPPATPCQVEESPVRQSQAGPRALFQDAASSWEAGSLAPAGASQTVEGVPLEGVLLEGVPKAPSAYAEPPVSPTSTEQKEGACAGSACRSLVFAFDLAGAPVSAAGESRNGADMAGPEAVLMGPEEAGGRPVESHGAPGAWAEGGRAMEEGGEAEAKQKKRARRGSPLKEESGAAHAAARGAWEGKAGPAEAEVGAEPIPGAALEEGAAAAGAGMAPQASLSAALEEDTEAAGPEMVPHPTPIAALEEDTGAAGAAGRAPQPSLHAALEEITEAASDGTMGAILTPDGSGEGTLVEATAGSISDAMGDVDAPGSVITVGSGDAAGGAEVPAAPVEGDEPRGAGGLVEPEPVGLATPLAASAAMGPATAVVESDAVGLDTLLEASGPCIHPPDVSEGEAVDVPESLAPQADPDREEETRAQSSEAAEHSPSAPTSSAFTGSASESTRAQ